MNADLYNILTLNFRISYKKNRIFYRFYRGKLLLSAYDVWKDKSYCVLYCLRRKLSVYRYHATAERSNFLYLSCGKIKLSVYYTMERYNFLFIILRKDKTFCELYYRKILSYVKNKHVKKDFHRCFLHPWLVHRTF